MNPFILNSESQEFISQNQNSDVASLIFKGSPIDGLDIKDLVEQIEAKIKCEKKLPTWFNCNLIYFPNKLNIEQTSSEITAKYKASLVEGDCIVDLTGGFGVDAFYFSKRFKSVIHCELNQELSTMVAYNYKQLGVYTIQAIPTDGLQFLKSFHKKIDWLYIDPSRRHDRKGKVFLLEDCLPNVPENLDLLFDHSNSIMIKTSPLLDISVGIKALKNVKTIHVVAVNNEVKELIWILEKEADNDVIVETVNIKSESEEHFKFNLDDESQLEPNLNLPLTYLYEPNSAILKSGGFNSVTAQLSLFKLHKHSHLYTNDELVSFPGRRFKILNTVPYQKKAIKKLGIHKANITTRNFPETVDQIRKKFDIKDGGHTFLFFTTNLKNEKVILECSKIK